MKTTKKCSVTIAQIERADPCATEYASFLRKIKGPLPSRAYFKREFEGQCYYGDPEYREKQKKLLHKLLFSRRVFKIGRHDPIEVLRIHRMNPEWSEWVERNVLTDKQFKLWDSERPIERVKFSHVIEEEAEIEFDYEDEPDEDDFDEEPDEEYL